MDGLKRGILIKW